VDSHLAGRRNQAALLESINAEKALAGIGRIGLAVPGRSPRDGEADAWVAKPVRESTLFDGVVTALSLEHRSATLAPAATQQKSPRAASQAKVLVVEDNRVNQKVAVALLDRLGYRSDVADDGVIALEMLAKRRYALVLMDCQMPRMDGYATTIEIRRREVGTRIPIIALTASAMAPDRERCLEVGMDDYLPKPIDRDQLAAALERWSEAGPRPRLVPAPT
jgi:CheY-like chemotaxis protein